MSETPLTDLEQLADQLIENWPGAWFAPINDLSTCQWQELS